MPLDPGAAFFNDAAAVDFVTYLYDRWQDEREYEDLGEYRDALARRAAPHGLAVVSMTGDPFVFELAADAGRWRYSVNGETYTYGRVA